MDLESYAASVNQSTALLRKVMRLKRLGEALKSLERYPADDAQAQKKIAAVKAEQASLSAELAALRDALAALDLA